MLPIPLSLCSQDPTHSRCSEGTLRKLPAFSWDTPVLTRELGTHRGGWLGANCSHSPDPRQGHFSPFPHPGRDRS